MLGNRKELADALRSGTPVRGTWATLRKELYSLCEEVSALWFLVWTTSVSRTTASMSLAVSCRQTAIVLGCAFVRKSAQGTRLVLEKTTLCSSQLRARDRVGFCLIKCQALRVLSTDWQNDKFAGHGSFTNLPVGFGDAAEHLEALRNAMGQDRGIRSASEHTSPSGGLGTVNGAYWSEDEVAKREASHYGIRSRLRGHILTCVRKADQLSGHQLRTLPTFTCHDCTLVHGISG
ncbi:hypothetical protein BJ170DRAFT_726076 [Xylariales sp. AK1849]|nr:hypothetical protein BJ170DRAFT_726076 [Xylariales sp. AK1849]